MIIGVMIIAQDIKFANGSSLLKFSPNNWLYAFRDNRNIRSMNNGKKEFPICGMETEVVLENLTKN